MTTGISGTTANAAQPRPVVVGVDGSESSKAALAWAVAQKQLSGLPLVAISTWEWPTSYGSPIAWPENIDFEADAREMLEQSIEEVVEPAQRSEITPKVLHGHPALILEEQSRGAALVVVGSRGHGEFAGMLLGSVSEFLATHAHCPVVIVRDDKLDD